MALWKVELIKIYHSVAEIEVEAETEQGAITLAEQLVEEDDWSDYHLMDQFVEETKKI